MAWPTDLARGSTNAFSPESLISKNLMDQALTNERNRIATLSRQASISDSDSDSDDEKTTSPYQKIVTNHFYHKNFKNKPAIATIKADSASTPLLFKNVKTGHRKESSLRHIFFPCCCIQ